MALNIFPKRRDTTTAETPNDTEPVLPEPSPEALAAPARRGRTPRAVAEGATATAPRSRSRKPAADAGAEAPAAEAPSDSMAEAPAAAEEAPSAPRGRARQPRRPAAAEAATETTQADPEDAREAPLFQPDVASDDAAPEGDGDGQDGGQQEGGPSGEGRGRRRRGGRGRGRRNDQFGGEGGEQPTSDEDSSTPEATDEEQQPQGEARPPRDFGRGRERGPRPERPEGDQPRAPRGEPRNAEVPRSAGGGEIADLSRQVERLIRTTEELSRRGGGGGNYTPPVRVGVFVDTANIELACDRLRVRFDWGKVLRLVTQDRQLIRAMAYSPIHDDLSVSIETQRFVEPFLDKGFKVVTKPFRRFQDGSIKANLDIELALDIVTMLDRLDVVVLISGDGDFQKLVELAQGRGVRVEVAAVGTSTATNLKHAADLFIDLGARARDLRA